jgi:hypothetical protein
MKIAGSAIAMTATHAYSEQYSRQESLRAWVGDRSIDTRTSDSRSLQRLGSDRLSVSTSVAEDMLKGLKDDQLSLSARAMALAPAKAFVPLTDKAAEVVAPDSEEIEDDGLDLKLRLMKMLLEHLTGRKIELMKPSDLNISETSAEAVTQVGQEASNEPQNDLEGWGLVYDYYESYQESETLNFNAKGLVNTADGQAISIDLSLSMSRDFAASQQISIRAGDALKDPLVVNFAGTAAQLGERDFHFDLDADGRLDQIAFVGPGSGFLALDKNGDGRINDGSELFGPTTGSGFGELAAHDEDKNNWIDENDSIYDRLRIWTRDASGQQQLLGLGQAGVGAIYLGNIQTPFLLKDADNQLQGQIKGSGIYLKEQGGVGSIQELDLVV